MKQLNLTSNMAHENKDNSIFKSLEKSELDEINRNGICNSYKKNQAIFLQGNIPFGIYYIHTGKIKNIIVNDEGKESILGIAGPGDLVGQRSLFSKENYNASAIAIEESVVCFFEKEFFFSTIKKFPIITLNLLSQISYDMGIMEMNNVNLVHKNARERLALLLIDLKDTYGVTEAERIRLDIKLTREEMAAMIGTTHETLVRLFTEFKNEQIIIQEGKVIYIINSAKLKTFSNA